MHPPHYHPSSFKGFLPVHSAANTEGPRDDSGRALVRIK